METSTQTPTANFPRIFVRCKGCLQATAIEEAFPRLATCDACGGEIEYMGRVSQSRLVKDEERCPCDDRCTMAQGPNCDCACGGKNHGSKMVVTVVRDAGAVPRIRPLNVAKAVEIAGQFNAALTDATEKLHAAFHEVKAERLGLVLGPYGKIQAMRGRKLIGQLRHAASLRTHYGRMKAIQIVQEDIERKAIANKAVGV